MMFGRGESFDYIECRNCGSLQIADVPEDLGRYYPEDYYAHGATPPQGLRDRLNDARNLVAFEIGSVAGQAPGPPLFAHALHGLKRQGLRRSDRILDVGCGTGALLVSLSKIGFRRLVGVDPYSVNTSPDPHVSIRRGTLTDLSDTYDLIIFNHSLEHVPDPVEVLILAAKRLSDGGHILIRIPVAGCQAWREQGVDWIQLDAPRHLAIPTPQGLKAGASRAGLTLADVVFDSYWLQFAGAKIYENAPGAGLAAALRKSPFSPDQMKQWNRAARKLNADQDGDQGIFVLQRANGR
jgi:SAM-dependent methyltransferase